MLREYRSFLCIDDYYDLDIKKCQPTILEQYCNQHNIDCKQLTKYVNKRELIYDELTDIPKDDIKKAFTIMMFGGAKPTFKSKLVNIDKFYIEIKEIQTQVVAINNDWFKYANKKDKLNINGSVTSYVCQEIENDIVMTAYKYLADLGYTIGALCFDGLMIRKTKELNKKVIDDLNKSITKLTKYKIEFLIKSFEKTIDVTDDELNQNKMLVISDDLEGVNIVRILIIRS